MRLYFAHNFENRHEFRGWELEFEKKTGIELLNPFYDAPEKADMMRQIDAEGHTTRDRLEELKKWDLNQCRNVVYSDLARLDYCDGLFTIIDKPSFGTTCEICHCRSSAKPVYVVTENYGSHPWIRVYATRIWPHLELFEREAVEGNIECPSWTMCRPPIIIPDPVIEPENDEGISNCTTCDYCGESKPGVVLRKDERGLCKCEHCRSDMRRCPTCDGQGHVIQRSHFGVDSKTCWTCHGDGYVSKDILCGHNRIPESCIYCHDE